MMLAASDPDDTGPIVINGAPMSYWGGACQEGAGDNPMRYAGGMLGGTWLASFTADLGDGIFDGAYLVENFENLQSGQHVLGQVLPPVRERRHRAAALPRVRALVGRLLPDEPRGDRVDHAQPLRRQQAVDGRRKGTGGKAFDLREIKAPIVLFASMGDNITPPQQAFNWVADVYGSTDEIKARGQVIVGLLHQDIGHLGIFVSGKVAKKEHAQIVSVLKSIEALPPGLYGMEIHERKGRDGKVEYEVEFHERQLEDIAERLNRFERADEKPFEAVAALSRSSTSAPTSCSRSRSCRRCRTRSPRSCRGNSIRCASSAGRSRTSIRGSRGWGRRRRRSRRSASRPTPTTPARKVREDGVGGHQRVARLLPRDARRDQRGGVLPDLRQRVLALPRRQARGRGARGGSAAEPRELPFVKEALASIEEGGYRRGAGARRRRCSRGEGAPLPLARLALKQELTAEYRDLLPDLTPDEWRRIRGEQDIIVRYEPEQAIATLPKLLAKPGDRERLLTLVRRLLADERMRRVEPTTEQLAMIENIGETLDVDAGAGPGQRAARASRRASPPRSGARPGNARASDGDGTWNAKHEKYQRLIDVCKTLPPTPTAVAHPCDESSLRGAVDAAQARPDRADPGRSAGADRGGREASTASTSPGCRSSTRRTARPRPRRRSSWCARARPRR